MTLVLWMTAGSAATWLTVFVLAPSLSPEVFLGMFGPLVAVAGTWIAIERVYRANPAKLTAVMMAGFAVKLVFFALYIVAVGAVPNLDMTPFVVSFVCAFVALYAIEAVSLRRLSEGTPAGR
jgi:hypothetical protein